MLNNFGISYCVLDFCISFVTYHRFVFLLWALFKLGGAIGDAPLFTAMHCGSFVMWTSFVVSLSKMFCFIQDF